jgi:5'-nucleotidase (lipoprotein e(P4) family)
MLSTNSPGKIMNTKNYFLTFSLVVLSAFSTYLVTNYTAAGAQTPAPQAAADNEYQVAAILFMQQAAEYRALAYQAFNLARWQLDADLDRKNVRRLPRAERNRPRAVVVDIDETILDNSPGQAYLIKQRRAFNLPDWYAWGERRSARAIPGAVDFLNYATSRGVKVFYVSNRDDVQQQATVDNLKNVSLRDISNENVMLRVGGVSTKEPRRKAIEQNYRVVLLMGDNLDDFSDEFERKSVSDRFAVTDKFRGEWGRRFIVLPNAMYGTWENAIYEYERLTEAQKTEKRMNALQLP